MKKRAGLKTRIVSGYMLMVLLIGVVGVVGYRGIGLIGRCLTIVGDEEAPVLDMAMEMKLAMMTGRDAMGEFKSATSVLASDKAGAVDACARRFDEAMATFDRCAAAIVEGGDTGEGGKVIKTDNERLAGLVKQADALHEARFRKAAAEMMEAGRGLLVQKQARDKAMADAETAFNEVITDATEQEAVLQKELARNLQAANASESVQAIIRDEVPVADLLNEIKLNIARTRLVNEEFVQQQQADDAAFTKLEDEFAKLAGEFDAMVKAIENGGEVGGVKITATDNAAIRNAVIALDKHHGEFEERARHLMSTHRQMVLGAARAEAAMAAVDQSGEASDVLLAQVEDAAYAEMDGAKQQGRKATRQSTALMVAIGLGSALLGIILGLTLSGRVTRSIAAVVQSLQSGSEQVASSSAQVASAGQQMAEGSSEQASSLEETSASLEEMAAMTRQSADNANQANVAVQDAQAMVRSGVEAMTRMSTAIDRIKTSSDETARILKTIDEIAFQTNLLALNAAVEAARAGDAGKGFAVVAEEVRNLAQRSAEAAKSTAALIEDSRRHADGGVSVTADVAKNLEGIQAGVQRVGALVAEIAEAAREQATGIEQVNTAVSEMDKVVQENAASAEESASAAEELSSQAEELDVMVGELRAIVTGDAATTWTVHQGQSAPARRLAAASAPHADRALTGRIHAALAPAASPQLARKNGHGNRNGNGNGRGNGNGNGNGKRPVGRLTRLPENAVPLDEHEFAGF